MLHNTNITHTHTHSITHYPRMLHNTPNITHTNPKSLNANSRQGAARAHPQSAAFGPTFRTRCLFSPRGRLLLGVAKGVAILFDTILCRGPRRLEGFDTTMAFVYRFVRALCTSVCGANPCLKLCHRLAGTLQLRSQRRRCLVVLVTIDETTVGVRECGHLI